MLSVTNIKIRDLLFIIIGFLALMGTTANSLLLFTVWEQYQNESSQKALYKLIGSLFLAGVSTLVLLASIYIVMKHLSAPLRKLTNLMNDLSNQDLDIEIPYQNQKNEFGKTARALSHFRDKLRENKTLQDKQAEENRAKIDKARNLEKALAGFDSYTHDFINNVQTSMQNLVETAQGLRAVSKNGLDSSQGLQATANEASHSIANVSEAAETMLDTIARVSQRVSRFQDISADASTKTKQTAQSVHKLQEAADNIEGVITLINDIAKQTNMLALNATIEAERAGVAGQSFAVVAGEVKKLASQTSDATQDIRDQVDAVKTSMHETMERIAEIENVMSAMNETLSAVSGALEEQNTSSTLIASNAREAVAASSQVLDTSNTISQNAQATENSAKTLNTVSKDLSDKTDALCKEMKAFFIRVKNQ